MPSDQELYEPQKKALQNRVHRALALYHGMGSRDPMTIPEVAEEMELSERTIKKYLNRSAIAEEVHRAIEDTAAQIRKELVIDLYERLEKLRAIEEELMDGVEAQVTGFRFEEVEAEVSAIKGAPGAAGPTALEPVEGSEGPETVDVEVPIPAQVKQVPQFDRLQRVWEEQRDTQEQLEDLLGLEEPEEVDVSHDVEERKVWKGVSPEEDELPAQEVSDVEEQDSV